VKQVILTLHEKQKEVYRSTARNRVVCAARRFGKTRLALTVAITAAVGWTGDYDPLSPPVVLIGAYTQKQAKALYWKPLLSFFEGQPFTQSINKSELTITLPGNRPSIVLRGTDASGDSIRGLKLAGAVLDEVQQIPMQVINEVLRPALADTVGSRSLFIGTPAGKQNTLYYLREEALRSEAGAAAYFKYTALDNPFFPRDELERLRLLLTPRQFRQELEAEFEDFAGALFTELTEANVVTLEHEPGELYYAALDPGAVNPAIVVLSLTPDNRIKVWYAWWEGATATTAALVKKVAELERSLGHELKRIFIPDDRPDLTATFRASGYPRTVTVPRSSPGPAQRISLMDTLYHQRRLLLDTSLRAFFEEQLSLHRDTNALGVVTDVVSKGQPLHRTDALGYGIGALVKSRKSLLALIQGALSSEL